MRKLGVAAASAALIGTIAAVLPAGVAKADVTGVALPDPIAGVCGDVDARRTAGATPASTTITRPDAGTAPDGQRECPPAQLGAAKPIWRTPPGSTRRSTSRASRSRRATPPTSTVPRRCHPSTPMATGWPSLSSKAICREPTSATTSRRRCRSTPTTPSPSTAPVATASASAGSTATSGGAGDGRTNVGFVAHHVGRRARRRRRRQLQHQRRRHPEGPAVGADRQPDAAPTDQDPHIRAGRWYGTDPKPITPVDLRRDGQRPSRPGRRAAQADWHRRTRGTQRCTSTAPR